MVRAALDAGVESKHLEEMGRLLQHQGLIVADEPSIKKKPVAPPTLAVDALDDEEPDDDAEGGAETAAGVQLAVMKVTAIPAQLAEGKKIEGSLDAILDGAGSAESCSLPSSSRKNAAALRALRERLSSHPKELAKVIEKHGRKLRSSYCPAGKQPNPCVVSGLVGVPIPSPKLLFDDPLPLDHRRDCRRCEEREGRRSVPPRSSRPRDRGPATPTKGPITWLHHRGRG